MLFATLLTLTNVVGAVTSGEFVRADAASLTIRSGTVERTFSWTALKPAERERILIAARALPPPPAVRRIYARLDAETARVTKMRDEGWMTREAAARQIAAERRNADARLDKLVRDGRLSAPAAAYFSARDSSHLAKGARF